jgi:hypothetical protein
MLKEHRPLGQGRQASDGEHLRIGAGKIQRREVHGDTEVAPNVGHGIPVDCRL